MNRNIYQFQIILFLVIVTTSSLQARQWRKAKVICGMDYTTAPNFDQGIFNSLTDIINENITGYFYYADDYAPNTCRLLFSENYLKYDYEEKDNIRLIERKDDLGNSVGKFVSIPCQAIKREKRWYGYYDAQYKIELKYFHYIMDDLIIGEDYPKAKELLEKVDYLPALDLTNIKEKYYRDKLKREYRADPWKHWGAPWFYSYGYETARPSIRWAISKQFHIDPDDYPNETKDSVHLRCEIFNNRPNS